MGLRDPSKFTSGFCSSILGERRGESDKLFLLFGGVEGEASLPLTPPPPPPAGRFMKGLDGRCCEEVIEADEEGIVSDID